MTQKRSKLSDYFSVAGIQYLFEGIEDTLGQQGAEVIYQAAAKKRGREIAMAMKASGVGREAIANSAYLIKAIGTVMEQEKVAILEDVQIGDGYVLLTVSETLESATSTDIYNRPALFTGGFAAGLVEAIMGIPYQVSIS